VETAHPLAAWESYYVIVGTSGAALIGMQFVVMTLLAERRQLAQAEPISAFATPTIVHLAVALIVSAIMSAPWESELPAAIVMSACGLLGLVYCGIVVRRARRQTAYRPVWEDWMWYCVLPASIYAALAISAVLLYTHMENSRFVIAATTLALLAIGIHNAWDSITHIVTGAAEQAVGKDS
jgi:lipid-A-disaccharide synthase-like uncharacterized protein